jgi:hypothetical protein
VTSQPLCTVPVGFQGFGGCVGREKKRERERETYKEKDTETWQRDIHTQAETEIKRERGLSRTASQELPGPPAPSTLQFLTDISKEALLVDQTYRDNWAQGTSTK